MQTTNPQKMSFILHVTYVSVLKFINIILSTIIYLDDY